MKVFVFDSNCVKDVEHIYHLANIVEEYLKEDQLLVIISAMDNVNNVLRAIADNFYEGKNEEAIKLFNKVKKQHLDAAKYLLVLNFNECLEKLVDLFTEVEWMLHDKPVNTRNYYYDQIVTIGAMLSSMIISSYLNEKKISNAFIDVRDVMRTDDNFKDATVDWKHTLHATEKIILPALVQKKLVLTQGGIGCTDENESTTFNKQSSDYSAAVFANILNAEQIIIWSATQGLMTINSDKFSGGELIKHLNYSDAATMALTGELFNYQSIKPLQEKNIFLIVKNFYDTGLPGTIINNAPTDTLHGIITEKNNQVLMHIGCAGSFKSEELERFIQSILKEIKLVPTFFEQAGDEVKICIDDDNEKIDLAAQKLVEKCNVHIEKGIRIISFQNFTKEYIDEYTQYIQPFFVKGNSKLIRMLTR